MPQTISGVSYAAYVSDAASNKTIQQSVAVTLGLSSYRFVTIFGVKAVTLSLRVKHLAATSGISVDYQVLVPNSKVSASYYTSVLSTAVSSGSYLQTLLATASSYGSTSLQTATSASVVIGSFTISD